MHHPAVELKMSELCNQVTPVLIIFQLGGDFVLDEGGKVIFSHPSKSPTDRPTVGDVLAANS